MAVLFDKLTGAVEITEVNVTNVEGTYYSEELKALKEQMPPLIAAVQKSRAEYLKAVYDVYQAKLADIKIVEEKEAELEELSKSKEGVLVAAELIAINKAEKELREEIEATKEVNATLIENRKVIYEDAADKVFTALEAYLPVLNQIRKEYEETKSDKTAKIYENELKQFEDIYLVNGKQMFVSLRDKIQPHYSVYGNYGRRFGVDSWRGHDMQVYDRL